MSALQRARPLARLASPLSTISAERLVDCPFSLSLEKAHLIFKTLEAPGLGVRIPFRSLGIPVAGGFTHRVKVSFHREADLTERGRAHDEIDFSWDARSRWLPEFNGVLRMRIEALKTRVLLLGDYVPPLGRSGAMFDQLVGRRLALMTATDLMDRLAGALEARSAMGSDMADP